MSTGLSFIVDRTDRPNVRIQLVYRYQIPAINAKVSILANLRICSTDIIWGELS